MSVLSSFLSDRITIALGWNIVHILWQGIIVSLILALVLRYFKHGSAQLRYLISIFSLFFIVGLSVFNFSISYNNVENAPETDRYAELPNTYNLDIIEYPTDISENYYENITRIIKKQSKSITIHFPLFTLAIQQHRGL